MRVHPIVMLASLGLGACGLKSPAQHNEIQGVIEFEESVVGFELGGRVRDISVNEGDWVEKSQKLAALDDALDRSAREARLQEAQAARKQAAVVRAGSRPEEIEAAAARLRAARATETLAEQNLKRQAALFQSGAVSKDIVDLYESRFAQARADRSALEETFAAVKKGARKVDIAAAEAQADAVASSVVLDDTRLERHTLLAPFGGTILERHVEPGEVVNVGTPIVTIGDTKHPYADVFIQQGAVGAIHVGQQAYVKVDSVKRMFTGKVERIGKRTEFTPRYLFSEQERPNLVIRVRIRIDDPEQKLHAGVPAFVKLAHGPSQ